jgi:hypothetical protein
MGLFGIVLGLIFCLQPLSSISELKSVHASVETFDWLCWIPGWSKAAGQVMSSEERSPDLTSGRSMLVEVHFSGRGFEWFSVKPPKPIWLPGKARGITIRYKVSSLGYTIALEFIDGWGRLEVDGKKLSWALPVKEPGQWQVATFTVPENWLFPIAINGLTIHNWDRQNEPATLKVWIDQIDAQVDLSSADLQTGLPLSWRPNPDDERKQRPPVSLFETELTSTAENHVFAGEQPTIVFRARNWLPQQRQGKVTLRVTDFWGNEVYSADRTVTILGLTEEPFRLALKRFGWYQVQATLIFEDGTTRSEHLAFAFVPPPRELTEVEKLLSPYGLNVHGGRERLAIEPFRKAGIVWFRDYAFGFETMLKAKGDGRFDGWPWYHQLLWRYRKSGAKVLACLQGAIKRPNLRDGKLSGEIGPNPEWRREMASIIASFPQITHWELDNEYDLSAENRETEERIEWLNYRAFHKAFAEIIAAIGGGNLVAVEQGQAGVYPERIRKCVESGDFEGISVVNVHHYCGSDPPELNTVKISEGGVVRKVASFFDLLREAKQAATSDRKQRQLWLTEFGWDTLAGPKVSTFEQAVYLQRGWLLALAAGVDKAFWFYDFDSPEPKQFFDGCGLLTADGQPKLSLCALSALTHLLPNPRYIGDCNAGSGTQGFVFETDGKLVLALWSIDSDLGPIVKFETGQPYDFLANPLSGKSFQLSRAPLFVVGISRDSVWFKQTAYSLETPYFVSVAAGDSFPVQVRAKNNRGTDINSTVRVLAPENWQVDRDHAEFKVPPNAQSFAEFVVSVPAKEPVGVREVLVVIEEDGRRLKEIRVKVFVLNPIALKVLPIEGGPGEANLKVQLMNNSSKPASGTLSFRLPKLWRTEPEFVTVDNLKPNEVRTVEVKLHWTSDWQIGESAQAVFGSLGQALAWDFIVPTCFKIHRAPKVNLDGKLDEWGEKWAVPFWLLRSTFGEANARIYLAWSPEGLYVAAEIRDSVIKVTDPRNFWMGDCLELFIDTRNDKRPRSFEPGDHQFWFVPLIDEGRVYAGQWKRGNEIAETRYDLPVKGAARKIEGGYIVEFLLPANFLQGFKPQTGAKIGLNINLTVRGKHYDREVYWHRQKDWSVLQSPHLWGTAELCE